MPARAPALQAGPGQTGSRRCVPLCLLLHSQSHKAAQLLCVPLPEDEALPRFVLCALWARQILPIAQPPVISKVQKAVACHQQGAEGSGLSSARCSLPRPVIRSAQLPGFTATQLPLNPSSGDGPDGLHWPMQPRQLRQTREDREATRSQFAAGKCHEHA